MSTIYSPGAVIHMDVCQYAQMVRAASRNGMSQGGGHRVIGEIPLEDYFALARQQAERGEDMDGRTLKHFLNLHPEYRTVRAINSGESGQIRVHI